MKANFAPSLAAVLCSEGGYVNDPQDPGAATNKGVTQAVYDDWRSGEGLASRSVRYINSYEVGSIYRRLYWNACRGDDLPLGVDYCVFDFGVNSGVNRACRYLQRALGVADDGQLGPVTLAAAAARPATALVDAICDLRLGYLQQLPTWGHFGRGWTRRVSDVGALARSMAG